MFKNLFSSSGSNKSGGGGPADTKELQDLIEGMVRGLVDNPGNIDLRLAENDGDMLTFELKVAKADLGKVIGKKGRTASAMRTILSAASRRHNVSADLRIVE